MTVEPADPSLAWAEDRALGCAVRLVVTPPASMAAAKRAVDAVLERVDEACSRFRPDSELMLLNACPDRDVAVSPLLLTALQAALRAAELTQGAVDPTVGKALGIAGYDRDFALLPSQGAPLRLAATPIPGWRTIKLDPRRRTARIPRGVEVDLGATAKALAADLAAAAAMEAGAGAVLLSLGGDMALRGEPPPGGWRIQIEEDSNAPLSDEAEAISLRGGGVATSSKLVRRWRRGHVELHHVIDPRTGLPAAGPWRTVSVVAANCLDANIASTAAIVLGAAAPGWLAERGLPARLVDSEGAATRVAGWPEPAGPSPEVAA